MVDVVYDHRLRRGHDHPVHGRIAVIHPGYGVKYVFTPACTPFVPDQARIIAFVDDRHLPLRKRYIPNRAGAAEKTALMRSKILASPDKIYLPPKPLEPELILTNKSRPKRTPSRNRKFAVLT